MSYILKKIIKYVLKNYGQKLFNLYENFMEINLFKIIIIKIYDYIVAIIWKKEKVVDFYHYTLLELVIL